MSKRKQEHIYYEVQIDLGTAQLIAYAYQHYIDHLQFLADLDSLNSRNRLIELLDGLENEIKDFKEWNEE